MHKLESYLVAQSLDCWQAINLWSGGHIVQVLIIFSKIVRHFIQIIHLVFLAAISQIFAFLVIIFYYKLLKIL